MRVVSHRRVVLQWRAAVVRSPSKHGEGVLPGAGVRVHPALDLGPRVHGAHGLADGGHVAFVAGLASVITAAGGPVIVAAAAATVTTA